MRDLVGKLPFEINIPLPDWWNKWESDPKVQIYSNYGIGGAYFLIALVAFIQLGRIQLRVPEYGWTTQKVFHLLNCLVSGLRCAIFFLRPKLDAIQPLLLRVGFLDLPGLIFFTTYSLLILFWAEIYHQARTMPTGALRPTFIALNIIIFGVEGGLWTLSTLAKTTELQNLGYILSNVFLTVVSAAAAFGFLLYGGRLFLMLQRFPIESRGRRKKLREVGLVTIICAGCFSYRAVMITLATLNMLNLELDDMTHPLLNILYFSCAEILPSMCVLYILRKLPPKRAVQGGYQQIPQR
uniref:THH1/TOM1/TOM3 domain-containing protein n=1 Tax=Polytomella parva TaxID=51329 RepID=A0A7S0UW46_9CHLO|mmetsp:Transcript_19200/g.34744  ORF Transcript_19200/g.34744 Transcript_19200/m.34744 type:complete len:296 (+) Transcript_19200:116-1003(+)